MGTGESSYSGSRIYW